MADMTETAVKDALRRLREAHGPNAVHSATVVAEVAWCSLSAARRHLDHLVAVGIAARHDDGGGTFRWRLSDKAAGER